MLNLYMFVGPGKEPLALVSLYQLSRLYPEFSLWVVTSIKLAEWMLPRLASRKIFVRFLDEDGDLLGLSLAGVRRKLAPQVRKASGWLYQQFGKLQLAYRDDGPSEYYLVIDADTIILNRVEFFEGPTPVFSLKNEYHPPYFLMMQEVFGLTKSHARSFISEFMVFHKGTVQQLLARTGNPHEWYGSVLRALDIDGDSNFSEFETYGNYVHTYFPDRYAYKLFNIKRFEAKVLGDSLPHWMIEKLATLWDVVTFETHQGVPRSSVRKNRIRVLWRRLRHQPLQPNDIEGEARFQ